MKLIMATPVFGSWSKVAPAFPEDQRIKLPSPIRSRSRSYHSVSSTFSEESLARHMMIEDEADDEDMRAIEAAVRPLSPRRFLSGPV